MTSSKYSRIYCLLAALIMTDSDHIVRYQGDLLKRESNVAVPVTQRDTVQEQLNELVTRVMKMQPTSLANAIVMLKSNIALASSLALDAYLLIKDSNVKSFFSFFKTGGHNIRAGVIIQLCRMRRTGSLHPSEVINAWLSDDLWSNERLVKLVDNVVQIAITYKNFRKEAESRVDPLRDLNTFSMEDHTASVIKELQGEQPWAEHAWSSWIALDALMSETGYTIDELIDMRRIESIMQEMDDAPDGKKLVVDAIISMMATVIHNIS